MLVFTLPFDYDALEPYISSEIMHYHFDKHHQGYVNKYNTMITGTKFESKDLLDVLSELKDNILGQDYTNLKLFENGAQAWNHDFLWKSMSNDGKDGKIRMTDALMCNGASVGDKLISSNFGSYEDMRRIFIEAGLSQFGSGWVWLVQVGSKIDICTTGNADAPIFNTNASNTTKVNQLLLTGAKPLAVCDVWEHAYYLQYKNDRGHYLGQFFDHLLNWRFVNENLDYSSLGSFC